MEPHENSKQNWDLPRPNQIVMPIEVEGIKSHLHLGSDLLWVATRDVCEFLKLAEANPLSEQDPNYMPKVFRERLETFAGSGVCASGCYSLRSIAVLFVSRFPGVFAVEKGCCTPNATNRKVCSFENMSRRILKLNSETMPSYQGKISHLRNHEQMQGECALSDPLIFDSFLKFVEGCGFLTVSENRILVDFDKPSQKKRGRPAHDKKYPGRSAAYRLTKTVSDAD